MAKPSIRVFKARDKDFNRCLSHAGYVRKTQAIEMGMNKSRLNTYKAEGYIDRMYVYDKLTKMDEECFFLTDKGRNLVTDMMGIDSFYRSNGVKHDARLAEEYQKLTLEQQRSWLTEKDLREVFQDRMQELRDQGHGLKAMELERKMKSGLISPGDGAYVGLDGQVMIIEIITGNYGKVEIQAKEDFAQAVGGKIQLIKI